MKISAHYLTLLPCAISTFNISLTIFFLQFLTVYSCLYSLSHTYSLTLGNCSSQGLFLMIFSNFKNWLFTRSNTCILFLSK